MSSTSPDPKNTESIRRLRRILDGGRTRFIVRWGVLAAGVPLFVLMSLLPSLGLVAWLAESTEKPVFNIATGAILWPIAGYLLGLVIWRAFEWRYDALMRR
ncbi:MAG: hypothetical protein IAE82_12625 [Opitutaceae bacterium]|nr:hypothetical protein [Opitutaceae bacterium]